MRWEKNKKHWIGQRVGLIAVQLEYVRYVGHLSKWFVFVLMFKIWSVCCLVNGRPTIGYNERHWRCGGLRVTSAGRGCLLGFKKLNLVKCLGFSGQPKLQLSSEQDDQIASGSRHSANAMLCAANWY